MATCVQSFASLTDKIDSALADLQKTVSELNFRLRDICKEYQPNKASSNSQLPIWLDAKFAAVQIFTVGFYLKAMLSRGVEVKGEVKMFAYNCVKLLERSFSACNSIKDDRFITQA